MTKEIKFLCMNGIGNDNIEDSVIFFKSLVQSRSVGKVILENFNFSRSSMHNCSEMIIKYRLNNSFPEVKSQTQHLDHIMQIFNKEKTSASDAMYEAQDYILSVLGKDGV